MPDAEDMTAERALEYYDKIRGGFSLALMLKKNHDYDEVGAACASVLIQTLS